MRIHLIHILTPRFTSMPGIKMLHVIGSLEFIIVTNLSGNVEFIEKDQKAVTRVLDDCVEPEATSCNKETGGKQRLQKWSRGHLFIVRGGGIIDKWSPLFKSVNCWNYSSILLTLLGQHYIYTQIQKTANFLRFRKNPF